MMKAFRAIVTTSALCLSATVCFASTITTVSSDPGTTFSYLSANYNQVEKGTDLLGSVVTATFGGTTMLSCTFDNTGNCVNAGNFSLVITPATSNTNSATWLVSDLRTNVAGNEITSLFINLGVGGSSYSPCVVNNMPTVNDSCGQAKSIGTVSAGTTLATASVFYTNELHVAQQPTMNTEWGVVVLTFQGTGVNAFLGGQTFGYQGDSDFVGALTADVPEPATLGMMGIALLGLGALKFRRRRSA